MSLCVGLCDGGGRSQIVYQGQADGTMTVQWRDWPGPSQCEREKERRNGRRY